MKTLIYGACGNYACLLYNLYVAASVTTQGRSLISSAATQVEMFMCNNVKFGSLDEIITFIHNVIEEKPNRKYDDRNILDEDIDKAECFYKIMINCGWNGYIPSEDDLYIVWEIICELHQEDINRLYYKNNLYSFVDNVIPNNLVIKMLKELNTPFLSPNDVNPEIKDDLNEFYSLLKEYVYYGHQIIDRMDRYSNMYREACIVTDTDSLFASFDGWFRYMYDRVANIDMPIKHGKIKVWKVLARDEFGDRIEPNIVMRKIEDEYDYDFYNDELVQVEKKLDIMHVIPHEGLRYSIVNIMAYCLGNIINDYMIDYTKHSFSYSEEKPCFIYMKNEFQFKRLLLTDARKNYASRQELQEGNIIEDNIGTALDIKGLPLRKSGTNKRTREKLEEILYNDVLNCDYVDQVKVLKELSKFEKEIYQSLQKGEKTFYKPTRIKSYGAYEDPMRIQGIKGAIVWNEIRGDLEPIDLEARNGLDILKIDINKNNINQIEDPEIRDKCIKLMENKPFTSGIDVVAVPRNAEIPKWLVNFINYTTIINDNLKLFPLDSIGLYTINNNNNYSNIVKL